MTSTEEIRQILQPTPRSRPSIRPCSGGIYESHLKKALS